MTDMPTNPTTGQPAQRVGGFVTLTRDQRWGWGPTQKDALAAARKAGSRDWAKGNRATLQLPEGALDAYVDQMGAVRWDWAEDTPDKTAHGDWVESAK